MKELTIRHLPAENGQASRVSVGYRAREGAQTMFREAEWTFVYSNEQRRLIQWYLEDYLTCPWGAFRDRAKEAEQLMERLGGELFQAVFSNVETVALYGKVADDLGNTRIVIQANDPESVALPWGINARSATLAL